MSPPIANIRAYFHGNDSDSLLALKKKLGQLWSCSYDFTFEFTIITQFTATVIRQHLVSHVKCFLYDDTLFCLLGIMN